MTCKIKSELVDFIYGEVPPHRRNEIKEHMETCKECKIEYNLLTGTKEMLHEWKDIDFSSEFEVSLAEKLKDVTVDEPGKWDELKFAFFSMLKTLSPAICAIMVTTIMVIFMAGNVEVRGLNPISLVICGVIWSGIYSMVFDLAIKNGSNSGIRMRNLLGLNLKVSVYYTFIAIAMSFILIFFSPLVKTDISYTQEFLYSFVPLFITTYLAGKKVEHNYILHGIFQTILYILLIGPALYMKCITFNFSLYVLLIAISSFGALFGSIAGSFLSSRVLYHYSKN